MQDMENTGQQLSEQQQSSEDLNNSRYFSEEIKGSPFTAVCEEEDWFITWGMWRISDKLKSREEINTYMSEQQWNLICAYSVALQQAARRYDKEMTTTPEEQALTN